MQASVLRGIDQPLQWQQVPTPIPADGEVLIRLKAAALNHRDVWIQKGQYAGLKFPCILGSDGAGTVVETGPNVDTSWMGKEVVLNPGLFWGSNPAFPAKEFRILGLPDDGTFAEYIRFPVSHTYPKPAHLSFEEAAALPLGGLTAYRALFSRAGLKAGEKVLITGIGGGVALWAFQFARSVGAQVYVTSGSDEKLERAKALGAVGGVNYRHEGWSKQLAAQAEGLDVIVDSAGGEGFGRLIEVAAPGGRIALYGGTNGAWKEVSPQRVFFKQLSLFGTTMGSAEEFEAMLQLVQEKQLKPVLDQSFLLSEAEHALRRMDGAEQFGKIVLKID
jgi:NADPH:quinone reductase-like Zn-dependent oxidoreductase